MLAIAPEVPTTRLLDPLIGRLAHRLVTFNRGKPPSQRLRLRVALHAGGVLADPQPLHGETVIHTCRLLDSPAARACLSATGQPLVVIVSAIVYDEVVKHGYGRIDVATWHPVVAHVKQDRQPAWIHVPGDPDAPRRAKVVMAHADIDGVVRLVPRELPGRLKEFTGRHRELPRLQALSRRRATMSWTMPLAQRTSTTPWATVKHLAAWPGLARSLSHGPTR